jgi:hypothetical protein
MPDRGERENATKYADGPESSRVGPDIDAATRADSAERKSTGDAARGTKIAADVHVAEATMRSVEMETQSRDKDHDGCRQANGRDLISRGRIAGKKTELHGV